MISKCDGSLLVVQEQRSMMSSPKLAVSPIAIETKSESNTTIHTFSGIKVTDNDLQGKGVLQLHLDAIISISFVQYTD